jgi:hypothetical protein
MNAIQRMAVEIRYRFSVVMRERFVTDASQRFVHSGLIGVTEVGVQTPVWISQPSLRRLLVPHPT